MTTIGYIFLDVNREALVPMVQQRQAMEQYAGALGLSCDEILVEQAYSPVVPMVERGEGKMLLDNVQNGDIILVMRAEWVFGSAKAALLLLDLLKGKGFLCIVWILTETYPGRLKENWLFRKE